MLTRIRIDGNQLNGTYTVECQCGAKWNGTAFRFGVNHYSPALPVAECAAHTAEEHSGTTLDVNLSTRFRLWLIEHWELCSAAIAREAAGPRAHIR